MNSFTAKLETSGRILIPAEIRRKLGFEPGAELVFRLEEDTVRILGTRRQALERVRRRLRRYVEPGRSLSQELIEERRAEAKKEL